MIHPFSQDAVNFVFLGEAGSGKSEIAMELARQLGGKMNRQVHFFDLDMTKPLFRSRDQTTLLARDGVSVHFEEQFMDAPTTTGGVRKLLGDPDCFAILDVGGDHMGARSIGGYAPLINQPDTAVYYVVNLYRPWSGTLERIDRVLGEILGVSHVTLDALRVIGNPNLGPETTVQDVLDGAAHLAELVGPYKHIEFLCARRDLAREAAAGQDLPVFPLTLSLTYPWNDVQNGT